MSQIKKVHRYHCGQFLELLGDGSEFGISLSYTVQEKAGGIGQAVGLTKRFVAYNIKYIWIIQIQSCHCIIRWNSEKNLILPTLEKEQESI